MKIYTFEDKTFLERIEDFNVVLEESSGGSIRDEWKDFLAVTIEPAHYKAIWKLSKSTCEIFNVKYPIEVFGEVQQTDFEELTVDFCVERVQNDNIHLPEICQVPLDEIFPTIHQEHNTLNIDITAKHLDSFRFFFNYVYLPFDNDDDFATKNLIPRVKLFYDLKNKQLSKAMSSYVRQIIAEVKNIQFKREALNNSIDELEEEKKDSKETIAKLLKLHLRMNKIKNEFEILMNPDMRDAYELIKFGRKHEDTKKTYVLTTNGTINEQVKLLEQLKEKISSQTAVNWTTSLTDTITYATSESEIFIPNGKYTLNFLDYINGNILLSGVTKISFDSINLDKSDTEYAIIASKEDSSLLFVIDGDVRFENLIIDCKNVQTGFLIKSGMVVLKNCLVIGSDLSSVAEAFNVSGDSCLTLINCKISNFSIGINIEQSKLELNNSEIENCGIGVNIMEDPAKVLINNSSIIHSLNGILKYSEKLNVDTKMIDLTETKELEEFGLNISDNSKTTVQIISKLIKGVEIDIEEDNEEGDVVMDDDS
ncbi:hypothetical protein PVAND_013901 [Polypedilum vanderplanki]|uniref:SHC SH2 domain-containing protein n=1 Tax=Polypedilum vanderplanki TaxID=319348 RepID=A0A9J6CS13_POLVA|nr:hypothetical protein PVAND_013901 [Polypedilum vanderplanki]